MLPWTAALLLAFLVAATAVQQGFVRFRRRARAYLIHTADIQWVRPTASGMVCAVLGYDLEVDLLNTYAVRWRRRLNETALFEELAAALRRQVPAVTPPPFPLVRDRIFPLLKRTATLPPEAGYVRGNRIIRRPLDDQISVAYVIEGQHRMTLVTDGMPESWHMTTDELHRLAVENLHARTRYILDEIGGPRTEYVSLDGFDAARLLVAGLIIPPGMADALLAIPHEQACLIAPATDAARLAAEADELFTSAQSPLTPRLYRLTPEGPVPERQLSQTEENAERRRQNADGPP